MATRIKSGQIEEGAVLRSDLRDLCPSVKDLGFDYVTVKEGVYPLRHRPHRFGQLTVDTTASPHSPVTTSGYERFDLITIDDEQTITVHEGTELTSTGNDPCENAPDVPAGETPICIVKIDEDTTVVLDVGDITDVREFLSPMSPREYMHGGFRNKIINGAMDIWQRQNTWAVVGGWSGYTADRWNWAGVGSWQQTLDRVAIVEGSISEVFGEHYSIRLTVDTADASVAAGDYGHLNYRVEGYDAQQLLEGWATLTFWVNSNKTGTYCFSVRNAAADTSYVVEYEVEQASVWEKKTIHLDFSQKIGTWNTTNGIGLNLSWELMTGSTYQTANTETWESGNYLATSNQVNLYDTLSNEFYLAMVQLEPGRMATPFERRPFGLELRMCQRYYEKSYAYGDYPGSATTTNQHYQRDGTSSSTSRYYPVSMKSTKRASPTITVYSSNSGSSGKMELDTSGWEDHSANVSSQGDSNFMVYRSSGAGNHHGGKFQWTAEAEL